MGVNGAMTESAFPCAARTAGADPRVSVAICTRARPEALRRALESLTGQIGADAELLVIDNASPDSSTGTLVRRHFPSARYIREPVAGLDFARNRALREARGDVVAFIDDDAVADPEWVREIRATFAASPKLGACTGRVEALTLDTPGARAFEANGGFARGLRPIRLPTDAALRLHGFHAPLIAWAVSVGAGCSLAVRRDLALHLGGFDEALDLGAALPGGGDLDMMWRILQSGAEVVYQPAVRARHEHRVTEASAHEQIVGHQRALVALLAKTAVGARQRRGSVLLFLLWRLLKPGVRLARRAVGRDPLPAGVLLRMWGACWRGLAAYPQALRLAERRREAVR